MRRYNPGEIEPKWQKTWDESGVYTADLESDKPKYIAMSMFNYPSGAGIHIGHAMNYTIPDVKARFKRQQGYESYHPVGWDSFGLPAENYAIKAGVSPQESMATIIPSYHKQYKAMGWSNDWTKEIATHKPEYYKWTQWVFSQMYKNKLAYQDSRMQWWCTKCQTVLANEQVIDDKCWRHDSKDDPIVEKKEVKQWFFKITEYADELLEAIDGLDWTESVKSAQKNWIGRSEGINIDYEIIDSDKKITCFTTTPVNYGMTFIVVAPEHEMVTEITTPEQERDIREYVKSCIKKTDLERQQEGKAKTGVFTGAYAKNQLTGEQVPIWVADFVLASFGTGAVQGCPAHDERDFEFASKYNLPIIRVVEGIDGEKDKLVDPSTEEVDQVKLNHGINRKMVNSEQFNGLVFDEAMQKTMDYFVSKGWGSRVVNYKMRDWSVSRQRYWGAPIPIVNCEKCGPVLITDEELPVVLPELEDFQPSGDGRSALARATEWLKVDCPKCGGDAERETDTLDTYICSSWYMYRYFDPTNTEKIFESDVVNKWMPIDFYNGADHATAHLLYARFIARFLTKQGLVTEPEPFKQFLFNGKVTAKDGTMFSKSKGNGIDPLEIINAGYGADALRTYLMFAAPLEIWARWDPKGVPGTYRFLNRLWNIVQEYNELSSSSSPSGLTRGSSDEGKEIPVQTGNDELPDSTKKELLTATHKMIKKVTEDIEQNHYNTAIASIMECLNTLYKLKVDSLSKSDAWQEALESVVACVAPFAPHVADELWQDLGHTSSIQKDSWPKWNEKYLTSDVMKIVVQVNGKVRATIELPTETTEEQVIEKAKQIEKVATQIGDNPVKKSIYVPQKLVNLVI
jgi:leucyl-tRNA synthetase